MKIMRTAVAELVYLTKSARTHERHIYGHIKSHQRLVRADVAGRLLATDMLFAGLKGKDVCTLSVNILCRSYDTARKFAHMILRAGKESYIRTAEAERHSKRLRISAYDIGAPLSRSLDDCKG